MGGRATDSTVMTVFQLPLRDDRSRRYAASGDGAPTGFPAAVRRWRLTFTSTLRVFQTSAGRRLVAHHPTIAAWATGTPSKPGVRPSVSAARASATAVARCHLDERHSDGRHLDRRHLDGRHVDGHHVAWYFARLLKPWVCAVMGSPFANAPPALSFTALVWRSECETCSQNS